MGKMKNKDLQQILLCFVCVSLFQVDVSIGKIVIGKAVVHLAEMFEPGIPDGIPAQRGVVEFLQEKPGSYIFITGTLSGLTPGKHGIHIYELGDLENGCRSLGGHYNPENQTHGSLKFFRRHIGDLGNIIARKDGRAHINIRTKRVPLLGPWSVIGRALVVTEKKDDLGLGNAPTSNIDGNSGAILGCGVIGIGSKGFSLVGETAVPMLPKSKIIASVVLHHAALLAMPMTREFAQNNVGVITFEQEAGRPMVMIKGTVAGLRPGKHGFHIHEGGDLEHGCSFTGGHYNPENKTHGTRWDFDRHVGDLGNIDADSDGVAQVQFQDSVIQLIGPHSIIGRTLVVTIRDHSEDDLGLGNHPDSWITGNAGPAFACGVIGIATEGFDPLLGFVAPELQTTIGSTPPAVTETSTAPNSAPPTATTTGATSISTTGTDLVTETEEKKSKERFESEGTSEKNSTQSRFQKNLLTRFLNPNKAHVTQKPWKLAPFRNGTSSDLQATDDNFEKNLPTDNNSTSNTSAAIIVTSVKPETASSRVSHMNTITSAALETATIDVPSVAFATEIDSVSSPELSSTAQPTQRTSANAEGIFSRGTRPTGAAQTTIARTSKQSSANKTAVPHATTAALKTTSTDSSAELEETEVMKSTMEGRSHEMITVKPEIGEKLTTEPMVTATIPLTSATLSEGAPEEIENLEPFSNFTELQKLLSQLRRFLQNHDSSEQTTPQLTTASTSQATSKPVQPLSIEFPKDWQEPTTTQTAMNQRPNADSDGGEGVTDYPNVHWYPRLPATVDRRRLFQPHWEDGASSLVGPGRRLRKDPAENSQLDIDGIRTTQQPKHDVQESQAHTTEASLIGRLAENLSTPTNAATYAITAEATSTSFAVQNFHSTSLPEVSTTIMLSRPQDQKTEEPNENPPSEEDTEGFPSAHWHPRWITKLKPFRQPETGFGSPKIGPTSKALPPQKSGANQDSTQGFTATEIPTDSEKKLPDGSRVKQGDKIFGIPIAPTVIFHGLFPFGRPFISQPIEDDYEDYRRPIPQPDFGEPNDVQMDSPTLQKPTETVILGTRKKCQRLPFIAKCASGASAQRVYRWYYDDHDEICVPYPWSYCRDEHDVRTHHAITSLEQCENLCGNKR